MAQSEALCLIHLPIELLDAIVALLDRPSHCALALTCKSTSTAASRALYATYTNRDAPSRVPFHLFLRTLCMRPELAAMVKVLDIRGWRSEFEVATGIAWQGVTTSREEDNMRPERTGPVFVSTNKPATTASRSLKLFEQTAAKIGFVPQNSTDCTSALNKTVVVGSTLKKPEDFWRLLRHGVEDAQMVLMLALLPNLTKLYIDGMSIYPTLDWHFFLQQSGNALRALRTFDLRGQILPHEDKMHKTTLNFLEFTPRLSHLHLSDVGVVNTREITSLMPEKKLLCFSVVNSQVERQRLQSLLSGQQLRHFSYKPGHVDGEIVKVSEDHLVSCLASSQRSLQDLTLYATEPSKSPIIKQFENLQNLEMPYQHGFIYNSADHNSRNITDTLRGRIPDSLKKLSLRHISPGNNVPASMKALAELKCRGEFPALKTISLNFHRFIINSPWLPPLPYVDIQPITRRRLGNVLEEAGLKLEVAQTD